MATKIAFITDHPPVSPDQLGRSCQRINFQLMSALVDQATIIFSTPFGANFTLNSIPKTLREKSFLITFPRGVAIIAILAKLAGKLISQKFSFKNLAFHYNFLRMVDLLQKSQTEWLFCSCDDKVEGLIRAYKLAQASHLPLAAYLVDDFHDGAVLSGDSYQLKIAQNQLPSILKKLDRIFVISEGFQQHLKETYDVDSIVLPLCFANEYLGKLDTENIKSTKKVTFLGSLSHFYVDGMRQAAEVITEINQQYHEMLVLQVATLSSAEYVKSLIGNYDCIECVTCHTLEEVQQVVAASLICFAPYSFKPEAKVMVSTSFPCKMMDYLNSGKFILVYGPEYCSSVKYFHDHGLPELIAVEDKEELKKAIETQLQNQHDYRDKYLSIIKQNHSYNLVASTVIESLVNTP